MKALVFVGAGRVVLRELDPPAPRPDEVLVRVRAVGICGSEVSGLVAGDGYRVPPLVMGHEFSGTRLDTGERVVVNPLGSCRRCRYCDAGRPNLCPERTLIGVNRPGAFAEVVAVPARNLLPMPADVSWSQGALVEPMATAVHALSLATAAPPGGLSLGVIGAGGLGLMVLLAGLSLGYREIHVADLSEPRLATARRCGATGTGKGLEGTYDVVVDAVGGVATRRDSLERLGPGGMAIWLGLHDDEAQLRQVRRSIRDEVGVRTAFAYTPEDFSRALEIVRRASVDDLVMTLPLEDGEEALDRLRRGPVEKSKVQLAPSVA